MVHNMVLWFLFLAILVVTTERSILQFKGHYIKQLLYHISDHIFWNYLPKKKKMLHSHVHISLIQNK